MRLRYLVIVLSFLCTLWIALVPAVYIFTLDENTFVRRLEAFSSWHLVIFVVFEVVLIPVGLALSLVFFWRSGKIRRQVGPIVGIVVGLWATTLHLTLPYIGVYPNILSAIVGSVLSHQRNEGPAYYVGTFATNMLIWPVVGWLVLNAITWRRK